MMEDCEMYEMNMDETPNNKRMGGGKKKWSEGMFQKTGTMPGDRLMKKDVGGKPFEREEFTGTTEGGKKVVKGIEIEERPATEKPRWSGGMKQMKKG